MDAEATTTKLLPKDDEAATTKLLSKDVFTCLESRDTIYIQQMLTGCECFEVLTGCEMSNRFDVKASCDSPPFFKLTEYSNCLVRQCCRGIRPFEMKLTLPNEVKQTPWIIYRRYFHCSNVKCMCPCGYLCNPWSADCCCGRQVMDFHNSDNKLLGRVREEPKAWLGTTIWGYYDELDEPKFMCTVTCCEMCNKCCCQDVTFDCTRWGDDKVIATLTRKCVCTMVDIATEKDNFEIKYSSDAGLSVMDKFGLMSIAILVKYMHFERGE